MLSRQFKGERGTTGAGDGGGGGQVEPMGLRLLRTGRGFEEGGVDIVGVCSYLFFSLQCCQLFVNGTAVLLAALCTCFQLYIEPSTCEATYSSNTGPSCSYLH